MSNVEVIEMLKEMQEKTNKCQGFIVGMVTKGWVIEDLLGIKIKEIENQEITVSLPTDR